MGPSSPNHTLSGRGDVGRLPRIRHVARLAGGAPLRWFTVGLKHDEIHVTEARSCNQEGDHFWRQPENTDLLWPSDCGRDNSRQAIGPLSVRWSRRVCKLLNSNCDPTPDSRTSVIVVCCKLRRRAPRLAPRAKLRSTPVAIRFGLVGVWLTISTATRQMSISRITPGRIGGLLFRMA